MSTMKTDYMYPSAHDPSVLRQVARGWEYQYGHAWIAADALWAECTCAPGHDSPDGCDLDCTVCEVLDRVIYARMSTAVNAAA